MKKTLVVTFLIFSILGLAIVYVVVVIPDDRPDRNMKADTDIRSLQAATSLFILDNKRLPTKEEQFDILLKNQIVTRILKDSWGHEYIYSIPGPAETNGFSIYSMGPNGIDERCKGDDICVTN